jgi:hypothetical protein
MIKKIQIIKKIKDELFYSLSDVLDDKKLYIFDIHQKISQYELVCSFPTFTEKTELLEYIGYPVQIRINDGKFGNEILLLRTITGELITWESQGFIKLKDEHVKEIFPFFCEMIEKDKKYSQNGGGYSINGYNLKVGWLVD